jgi:hypothetical protein
MTTEAYELPALPQSLINLIGEYGMARTDGVSDVERLHRWQQLIEGVKEYARTIALAAVVAERERCALLVDTTRIPMYPTAGMYAAHMRPAIAAAIRAG